jgi:phage gpG-like protein
LITVDTKGLSIFLDELGKKIEKGFDTRKALTESARLVASLIKRRTKAGLDVEMKPFTPYKGRRKGGRVDLDASGRMLGAIEVRAVSDTEAVVGIFDKAQQRKAIVHQLGLGKMPARRFFGVNAADADTLEAIERIFARELNKAAGKV